MFERLNQRIDELKDMYDIPELPMPEPTGDRLSDIMNLQNYLNQRVSVTRELAEVMPQEERVEWINRFMMALTNELEEMRAETPWKWWKKNQDFDLPKAQMEWVDCFHFFLSIGLVLGLTPEKIEYLYKEKNKINHQRQDTGY